MLVMRRVFGVTVDEDDEDREADHTSTDNADDEQLNTVGTDNPTNLFSSATGQPASTPSFVPSTLSSV